jgi:hypothetical protein
MTPALPKNWDSIKLSKIHAFGRAFDLVVTRAGDRLQLDTYVEGKRLAPQVFNRGATVRVDLSMRN